MSPLSQVLLTYLLLLFFNFFLYIFFGAESRLHEKYAMEEQSFAKHLQAGIR
jgi:hypothetical protein